MVVRSKTIIIVRDADEAGIIRHHRLAKEYRLLTLSPAAHAALKDEPGLDVVDTTTVYTNDSHHNSVRNITALQDEFKALAQKAGLSDIQIQAACSTLFYISGSASFFYEALKNFEVFYVLKSGELEELKGFPAAFRTIISRILEKRYTNRDHGFSAVHRLVMKTYNAYVAKTLKNKRKLLIVDGARPSSVSFAKESVLVDPDLAVLLAKNPVKNIYTALRHIMRSINSLTSGNYTGKRIPMYFFYPAKMRDFFAEADQIIAGAGTEFSKTTLEGSRSYLEEIFRISAGFEIENRKHIASLKPEFISTDAISSGFTISACRYAKEIGAKIVLFNHASHTAQSGESAAIANLWASLGRIYSDEASYMAARSPAVAGMVARNSSHGDKVVGVKHGEKLAAQPHDKFTILFAGNYLEVQNHIPWMQETPDEFIQGIAELAEAVGQLPEAKLIIRVKPKKKEFTKEVLDKFIPAYPNVEISNEGSFKDALAKADIMVASISTTIDEALTAGKPVLLHSKPRRYHHLPAMIKPPTAEQRSAVYGSTAEVPLVDLLKGIITAHQSRPLESHELAEFIWDEATPDMAGLAKKIIG